MNRRQWLGIVLVALAPVPSNAAPTAEVQSRRLQNRLELWANYASRTRNLVARYTLHRRSSLLDAPLYTTGTLVFVSPNRLILRDDGMTGSTTSIVDGAVTVTPGQPGAGGRLELGAGSRPAVDWLQKRLLRIFTPGAPAALIEGCRTHVPRGRGHKLDLMPPQGSAVRKALRSITLTFDPVAGAVIGLHISEAQGDVVELSLTDHRQNVDEAALATARGEAAPTPPDL